MAKSTSSLTPVPPHIFEGMLRGSISEDQDIDIWKDQLTHWLYSADQLNQLVSELKKSTVLEKKMAKELIDFIEKKIRS